MEGAIDDVILFCELSEPASRDKLTRGVGEQCRPKEFKEAEAFLFNTNNEDDMLQIGEGQEGYFMNCHPTDTPKFDVSACHFKEDEEGNPWITLIRFRQESIKMARGRKIWSPYLGSLYECFVDMKTGVYHGRRRLVNRDKTTWREIGTVSEFQYFQCKTGDKGTGLIGHEDKTPEWTHTSCQVLLGIAFTRDVQWRVVIHGPSGTSLSFPTNAAGAMAAFKNREKDEAQDRRAALRNWVKEHYRKRATEDGELEIKVRQHLRGRTPFKWLGMDCELVVSPWDERKNERLKQVREQEKALQTA
jgi:hypothetical protein